MDENDRKESDVENRKAGRPMKVYIKGKEPVRNWLTMAKEEWDFTPGVSPSEKGESIRFAARLLYGDGKLRLQWINDQIQDLKLEKQIDDLRFQRRLEVLSAERALVNSMSETFAKVRRDYPMFAFMRMMEKSFNESRSPDPKYYSIIWGITCDIDKVNQDREDMRFQLYDKETEGWESKYNVKKGPHGKRGDDLKLDMVNEWLGDQPAEAK
jgi:hypothetical protein